MSLDIGEVQGPHFINQIVKSLHRYATLTPLADLEIIRRLPQLAQLNVDLQNLWPWHLLLAFLGIIVLSIHDLSNAVKQPLILLDNSLIPLNEFRPFVFPAYLSYLRHRLHILDNLDLWI